MKGFCVICGKSSGEIIRGFCLQHFIEKKNPVFLPKEIQVTIEKNTGAVRHREKWLHATKELFEEIIKSRARTKNIHSVEMSVKKESHLQYVLIVKGKVDGVEIKIERQVKIQPLSVQSDAEMKLKSDYHEAVLQLRVKEKQKEKIVHVFEEVLKMLELEKEKDALAGVSGIKQKREGIDVMIGSKRATKKIVKSLAKKYGAKTIVSFKTIGQDKSGKEKKRFTYCVRI